MSDTVEICFRKKLARKKEHQRETKMTVDVDKKTITCECLGETFTSHVVVDNDFCDDSSYESGNIYIGLNLRVESEYILISPDWYWCNFRSIHLDRKGFINVYERIDGKHDIYETQLVKPTNKLTVKRFIKALMKIENGGN